MQKFKKGDLVQMDNQFSLDWYTPSGIEVVAAA